ncbi:MAG: hypothetical protein EOO57_04180 [Hymenobacter sp.]|nr:MAG: hypothetical protein EOO57_04180 [Hymenobacter sp.]
MSSVTSLMLSFSSTEKEQDIVTALNQYPNKNKGFSLVSINDEKLPRGWYGGTKMMETCLYLGAYNHFDVDDFINYLSEIEWAAPEEVQLFTKGQWADKFTVYNLLSN